MSVKVPSVPERAGTRSQNDRFFYAWSIKGRYTMKFLLLVLAIHLVAEMISNKIKAGKENKSV
jgi:hypothetical protein